MMKRKWKRKVSAIRCLVGVSSTHNYTVAEHITSASFIYLFFLLCRRFFLSSTLTFTLPLALSQCTHVLAQAKQQSTRKWTVRSWNVLLFNEFDYVWNGNGNGMTVASIKTENKTEQTQENTFAFGKSRRQEEGGIEHNSFCVLTAAEQQQNYQTVSHVDAIIVFDQNTRKRRRNRGSEKSNRRSESVIYV